eukprot:gnl/TRDRNA2_/TRDRNA2_175184_c2_seq1.p1 gnl/TRDRNA2_/TRDRNA2_175184_c2~~gnl/TRDRNA2_/TRDRNA2_175184_c2_seq1.p1  ORF type:complete len:337 (+),score=18.96 gnl/TRDRNA2_/TRDRNA2_175184_c2_seq1:34-1011(+)
MALCDVVVQLDDEMRIEKPSPQLGAMLLGTGSGCASELSGHKITEFFASLKDCSDFHGFIAASVGLGSSSNSPASALCMPLISRQGDSVATQIYHAHFPVGSTGSSHILGIRCMDDHTSDSQVSQASQLSIPSDVVLPTAMEDHDLSEFNDSLSFVSCVPDDHMIIGVSCLTFDAGSVNFDIIDTSRFFSHNLTPSRTLLSIIPPGHVDAVVQWVVDFVQAAPTDRAVISYSRPLEFSLHSETMVTRLSSQEAFLKVSLGDSESDMLPVTLHLRNMRIHQPMPLQVSATDYERMSISPSDSISNCPEMWYTDHSGLRVGTSALTI